VSGRLTPRKVDPFGAHEIGKDQVARRVGHTSTVECEVAREKGGRAIPFAVRTAARRRDANENSGALI